MHRAERRRNRSSAPVEATRLYLESLAVRQRWSAAALADRDGLLIAGTDAPIDAEALAAVAPIAADLIDVPRDGLLDLVTRGQTLHVWEVLLDDTLCYLAAVGDGESSSADAVIALERILFGRPGHC